MPIRLCNVWFCPSKGHALSPTSYDELVTADHPEPSDVVLVEREEVAVMYRVTDDNPEAMGRAWAELEAAVGLRGGSSSARSTRRRANTACASNCATATIPALWG